MYYALAPTILPMVGLDGTILTAFLGFLGITVTALCGVYVATRTNKSEKEASAQKAVDDVIEQRIIFRDEQIVRLKEELATVKLDAKLDKEELEAELDKKNLEIERLRGRNG